MDLTNKLYFLFFSIIILLSIKLIFLYSNFYYVFVDNKCIYQIRYALKLYKNELGIY